MKKILIANIASPQNPGDMAILRGTLKLCWEVFPGAQIAVSTRAFSYAEAFADLGCRVVPAFPNVEALSMDDSLRKFLYIPRALTGWAPLREAVREADLVLFAGGAYFYSYRTGIPGFTYLAHVSPVYWARRFRKPLILLPQSYGPFYSRLSRVLFDYVIRNSGKVFYREAISGDFLRERYGVREDKFAFLPDLAFYLRKEDLCGEVPGPGDIPAVGVTVRPWKNSERDEEGYLRVLTAALTDFAANHNVRIRLIVQVQDDKKTEGDEDVTRRLEAMLLEKLPREQIEFHNALPYFRLEDLFKLYAGCRLMISMRLHSALLSFIAGCPPLVAGYQHKAEGILKNFGCDELYLGDFHRISAGQLKEAMDRVWAARPEWNRRIWKKLEEVRDSIDTGFRKAVRK